MKQIIFIITLFLGISAKGQNSIVTATLSVKGNCEQCKKRIENAADIKGVKLFEWNEDTKVAKVIYNSTKTDLPAIEKAIAAKGYDTPNQKGDSIAYNKLPGCCRYRTTVCNDKK
jgi:periplasmic mercuric ion binding protein